MGTIADKLGKLAQTKADIKAAIAAKGQAVGDADPFASYAGKIAAIQTGVTFAIFPSVSNKSGTITSNFKNGNRGSYGTLTVTVNEPAYDDLLIVFPDFKSPPTYDAETLNFYTVTAIVVSPTNENGYACTFLCNMNNARFAMFYKDFLVSKSGNIWSITIPENSLPEMRMPTNINSFLCATMKLFV